MKSVFCFSQRNIWQHLFITIKNMLYYTLATTEPLQEILISLSVGPYPLSLPRSGAFRWQFMGTLQGRNP
jgi:hypothetical protein